MMDKTDDDGDGRMKNEAGWTEMVVFCLMQKGKGSGADE
jgi:hypothetical protein